MTSICEQICVKKVFQVFFKWDEGLRSGVQTLQGVGNGSHPLSLSSEVDSDS